LTVRDSNFYAIKNLPEVFTSGRFFLLLLVLFVACSNSNSETGEQIEPKTNTELVGYQDALLPEIDSFSRAEIITQLKLKTAEKKPLIVRVFVPLCDNKNQGIVPVSSTLGDGQNLKTNLYWGALYGVKTHFIKQGWQRVGGQLQVNDTILERIIFEKIIDSNRVIIIADAFAGNHMAACLNHFFEALADIEKINVTLDNKEVINCYQPDLVAFTGHNGLMDVMVDILLNPKAKKKDAIVLACISNNFFSERLNYINAYPLITTKTLMAPEAYVLNDAIMAWAKMEADAVIYNKAITAYSNYQKCSVKAASTVFKTGW